MPYFFSILWFVIQNEYSNMASGTLLHLRLFYPSISLSSNQRMVFSSIKSFSSWQIGLISPSVPPLPAYRCKGQLSAFSCSSPAISCSSCSNLLFLERHFPLVIQAHAGGLFLFGFSASLSRCSSPRATVTIIGVVNRKSRMSPCPLNTAAVYHLTMK